MTEPSERIQELMKLPDETLNAVHRLVYHDLIFYSSELRLDVENELRRRTTLKHSLTYIPEQYRRLT